MRTTNLSKNHIFLFLLLIISLLFLTSIGEATKIRVRVTVQRANIRLKPDITSQIIAKAPIGTVLVSEKKEGKWYKVNLPPDESGFLVSGYIHESTVEVVEEIKEVPKKEKIKDKKPPEIEEEKLEQTAPPVTQKPEVIEKTPMRPKKQGLLWIGLKGGLNAANLYGDYPEDKGTRTGFCLGGYIALSNPDVRFAIHIEFLLTQKGSHYITQARDEEYSLTYLEVPIFAKVTLRKKGGFKPFVFIGPYLAIKLNDKYRSEYEWRGEAISVIEAESLFGRKLDIGAILGAGVDFPINFIPGKLTIELRFISGMRSLKVDEYGILKTYNKVASLMLGYSFSPF